VEVIRSDTVISLSLKFGLHTLRAIPGNVERAVITILVLIQRSTPGNCVDPLTRSSSAVGPGSTRLIRPGFKLYRVVAPEDETLALKYSGDVVDKVSGLRGPHPWFLPLVSDSSRQGVIGELTSPFGTR